MVNGNGWKRATAIGTAVASIVSVAFVLGMCPKVTEIQTTIEAKSEHSAMESRTARAAEVQHDRIDAVLVGHRQLIDQQRIELKEYRRELRTDRQVSREAQNALLQAINNIKE